MKCCRYCVPPKRHPQCWSTCSEYIEEKEQANKYKEEDRKRRDIYAAIDRRKGKAADRAYKKRKSRR